MTLVSFKARATEPGSAMLIAAIAAMLLAATAALLISEARSARAASGETARLLRAEFTADKLIATAIARLDAGGDITAQGMLFSDDDGAFVGRQDASGLLDVNTAAPEDLAALFSAFGADAELASRLAARIGDWTDADDLTRHGGAEREAYERAGSMAPANHAFQTETEIALVLGMPAHVARCASPYLTVYSGAPRPAGDLAPARLRSLLGLEADTTNDGGAPFGRVIALQASAPISHRAALRRTLWIRLTGNPDTGFLVHRAALELAAREEAQTSCEVSDD